MLLTAFLLLMVLIVTGCFIIWEDMKSLEIQSISIYTFFLASVLLGYVHPFTGVDKWGHLISAGLALGIAFAIRFYFNKLRKIDGLGEADVWLIGAAGALVGPFLLGFWLFGAAALAIFIMLLPAGLFGKRAHPDDENTGTVLPLTPVLIVTSLILHLVVRADLLPANYFPIV